jgi:hypothetical protein
MFIDANETDGLSFKSNHQLNLIENWNKII